MLIRAKHNMLEGMHIHAWLRDVCLCERVCSREALIKSVLEGGARTLHALINFTSSYAVLLTLLSREQLLHPEKPAATAYSHI